VRDSYISDLLVTSTLANYQLLTFPIQVRERDEEKPAKNFFSERERLHTHTIECCRQLHAEENKITTVVVDNNGSTAKILSDNKNTHTKQQQQQQKKRGGCAAQQQTLNYCANKLQHGEKQKCKLKSLRFNWPAAA
jgi:hypothetical protein